MRPTGRGWRSRRAVAATLAFVGCVFVAALIAAVVGTWGRDLRSGATVAAVLLAVGALWLVGWRGYGVTEMLVALVAADLLYGAVIAWYAGAFRLDRLFLSWFLGGSMYLGLPWLGGTLAGVWLARRRSPMSSVSGPPR